MIKANFKSYATYTTDEVYQWDINQYLNVTGLNLSTAPEVHFENANVDRAIVKQAVLENHVVTVKIPNSLLQDPLMIKAHIGIYEGSTFKIVETVEIPVKPRKRPFDYQITDDEEVYSFKKLENMIEQIDEKWSAFTVATVDTAVNAWLTEHPEATTTVQDGALTEAKFTDDLKLHTLKDYVTPEMFGAKGDGVTDDTAAIQTALNDGKRLVFENGDYLVSDTLVVPSDIVIEVKNAKITSLSTENKKYIFHIDNKVNVKILGYNGSLIMSKPDTVQQACVSISNSENVLISGLILSKAGGDGVIVGGTTNTPSKNIDVSNCVIDNNYRNGVSIVGGVNGVYIHDCVVKNTGGTSPQLGIDVETWSSLYLNENIHIYNNRFSNNVNGDLTIFEYTKGVKVYNNHFDGNVSVKINTQYNGVEDANPTDISFNNNIFESHHYFYGIVYGGFSVLDNTYNGGKITMESPIAFSIEDSVNSKCKLIKGNTFNNSTVPFIINYSANMLICDNVVNNCKQFLNALGFYKSIVKGNLVNGYNVSGDSTRVIEFNGVVDSVVVENNKIVANRDTTSVAHVVYFKGGSTSNNIVRNNDFSNAAFTTVVGYDARGNNLDYGNASSECDNLCSGLPTASKKYAGMILSIVGATSIYTYLCTLSDGTYTWKDITAKL